MSSIDPGITGRAPKYQLEPLAVSPRQTGILLDVGQTRVFELLKSGELESYLDGSARKITMRSIRARQERLIAADQARRRSHKPSPKKVPPAPRRWDPAVTATVPPEKSPHGMGQETAPEMVPLQRRRGRPPGRVKNQLSATHPFAPPAAE
jgi:hypothetical protein